MKARRQIPAPSRRADRGAAPTDPTTAPTQPAPRWLLASAAALFVARPFVPGVGIAQEGHGAIFVILWLMLLGGWLIERYRHARRAACRSFVLGWIDILILAFFAIYVLSGILAVFRGSPRPAANVTWHWLSVAIAYFLFRQLLTTASLQRAAIAVVIGLAVSMAALGLEQALVSLPEARAEYMRHRDDARELYIQTGQWLPEGSAERKQFEARLASAEPTATFALSNSLAALLVPAIALLVGILSQQIRASASPKVLRSSSSMVPLATYAGPLAVMIICLWYTHSRSGVAAAVVAGFAAIVLHSKRPIAWLAGGGALAIVGGLGVYWLRRETFAAAAESLAFRLEYWQATWSMIREFPLFGCGPGQFQDTYTAYKLPAASEEVADPHNFLLEVWSTSGTFAAAALVASLIAFGKAAVLAASERPGETTVLNSSPGLNLPGRGRDGRAASANQLWPIYVGALGGVLLGAAAAWLDQVPLSNLHVLLSFATFTATLGLLHRWVRIGKVTSRLPGIAAGGLLLHLAVSGGIGEPGLASVLWLLLVLQLNGVERTTASLHALSPDRGRSIVPIALAAALVALLLPAAYLTYYRPALSAAGQLSVADEAAVAGQSNRVGEAFEAAVVADPWSIEAARRLAAVRFSTWQAAPSTDARVAWERIDEVARRLAPRRHGLCRESAERYAALFEYSDDPQDIERAVALTMQAIERYPTHADHHLYLAELLQKSGRPAAARSALAAAVKLDRAKEAAGHEDKTLPQDRRRALEDLARKLEAHQSAGTH